MEMDLELGLIVLGVALVAGIAVYFVSVMGIRERSFEEAIAEQKKRSEDLLGKREQRKKAPVKEKSKKRDKKKEREKVTVGSGGSELSDTDAVKEDVQSDRDAHSHEHPSRHHVEIQDEPQYLDQPILSESRRASVVRREGIKSILLNKEEVSPIKAEKVEVVNDFAHIHPKDDAELIHLRSLKKQASEDEASASVSAPPPPLPARKSRGNKRNDDSSASATTTAGPGGDHSGFYETIPVVDEIIDQIQVEGDSSEPSSGRSNASTNAKSVGKKVKGRSGSNDQEEMNAVKLESTIDRVPLSSSEIQNLIDILLNKQHAGDSEWINKGKNDTAGTLKKQLLEREKQLAEEQTTVQSLQVTLKKLRAEYTADKNKFAAVKKQIEDSAAQKVTEAQNLTGRYRQMSDVSIAEKQELQKQLRQLQQRCKEIGDEYESVKAECRSCRDVDQALRQKLDNAEREVGALNTQYGHQANQLQAAFQSNEELTKQVLTLQEHLRSLEERKNQEESHIHAHYKALMGDKEAHLVGELKKLQEILAATEAERSELRQQVVTLQNSTLKTSSETNKNLEDITKKLEDSHKAEKNTKNLLENAKAELRSLQDTLKEKEIHLKKSEEERETLKSEVISLNEQAKAVVVEKVNGDLKNYDQEEETKRKQEAELISTLELKLEERQKKLQSLETEANHFKNQVENIQLELKSQKETNNELKSKNVSLAESLKVTEGNLESRLSECQNLIQGERTIKETLHAHFPQVTIDKTKPNWAEEFSKRIEEEIAAAKAAVVVATPPPAVDMKSAEKVEELQEINTKLKDEVVHYQQVLASTESLLGNLQGSIEKEEAKWMEKLLEKESEVAALKSASTTSTVPTPDVSNLENELSREREEKSVLSQRCSELENNIQNLKTQAEQQQSLTKRVDELLEEVENERRKQEDILTENNRLQSLVNSAEESLTKVKALEAEIQLLKSQPSLGSPTNGVSNGSSTPAKTDNKSLSSPVSGLKEGGGAPASPSSPVPSSPNAATSPNSSSSASSSTIPPETPPTAEKKKKKKSVAGVTSNLANFQPTA